MLVLVEVSLLLVLEGYHSNNKIIINKNENNNPLDNKTSLQATNFLL